MSVEKTLVVAAGPHDRQNCPVKAELRLTGPVRLIEADSGREVPCQIEDTALWLLVDSLPKGTSRAYRLVSGKPSAGLGTGFGMTDKPGEALDFQIGGQFFTSYRYAANWAKPYFFPVIGPAGKRMTRSWPMEEVPGETRDHPHHKGIYVAHGDVNGADCWSEMPNHGRIVHREFLTLASGPVFAGGVEKLDWHHGAGHRVISETRRFAIYNIQGETRVLDVEVTLQAVEGTVKFADTKEAGLLSIRVPSSMDGKVGGLIENGYGGRTEKETWGKRAPWCDYSGQVDGEHLGIAIFDHVGNPRYPTYWHVRDYGLMTANCFGLHDYYRDPTKDGSLTLAANESVTFRYRVYIHRGDAPGGKVGDRWADYVDPPTVSAG